MSWTSERVDTLKKMLDEGASYGEIARHFGVSKNAVIGKCHRHGWTSKHEWAGRKKERKPGELKPTRRSRGNPSGVKGLFGAIRKASVKLNDVELPKLEDAPVSLDVPLFELKPGACKWPVSGAKAGLLCCGHPVRPNPNRAPYCAYHARLAFMPLTRPERRKT